MGAGASAAESGVIVDAAWVAAHLADPNVRLVEIDVSGAAYDAGHIPGAVLWNAYSDLRDSAYRPIGHAQLERLLSRSRVAADTAVVFYGYGAALGLWLMKAHGHADVRMLAGSRDRWALAGGRWSTDVPEPAESSYSLADPTAALLASRAAVETAIGDPAHVLLDVRAESEYSGERFWPSGATADVGRAGHIPGAISVPIDSLRTDDDMLKPTDELRRVFERAGVTSEKNVIAYCTIGNRASQAWFALTNLLGYPDVSVYYGSWVEWGKAPDTPVEPEPSLKATVSIQHTSKEAQ
jgi:thiosulfate/3-mercaptopyruvate sulfurtransferase